MPAKVTHEELRRTIWIMEIGFDLPNTGQIKRIAYGTATEKRIKLFLDNEMKNIRGVMDAGILSGRSYEQVAKAMFEEWKNWLDDNHEGMGLKIRDDAQPEVKEEFALWSEEHVKKRAMGYR